MANGGRLPASGCNPSLAGVLAEYKGGRVRFRRCDECHNTGPGNPKDGELPRAAAQVGQLLRARQQQQELQARRPPLPARCGLQACYSS